MEYLPHFDTTQTIIICLTLTIFSVIGYRVSKRANNYQKTAKWRALRILVLGCAIPVIPIAILFCRSPAIPAILPPWINCRSHPLQYVSWTSVIDR